MTPDWPSLWAREPGLKPEGVWADRDGYYLNDIGPLGTDAIPLHAGLALCRDAAVRWLTSLGMDLRISFWDERWFAELWTNMYGGEDDFRDQSETGDTLDAALFAVCAAVLDARGAK